MNSNQNLVGAVRFELTWNRLLFQLRIRQRRYTPIYDDNLNSSRPGFPVHLLLLVLPADFGSLKKELVPIPSHPSGLLKLSSERN